MSRTTPHTYYEQFVVPNLEDYLQQPYDIRRGFNACVPASQLADVIIAYFQREDPQLIDRWKTRTGLRVDLCAREPYFNTIQSAATAYKHLHAVGAHYEINTAGSLEAATIEAVGTLDAYTELDVLVHRLDGTSVSLTAALNAVVMVMWPAVLREVRQTHETPYGP